MTRKFLINDYIRMTEIFRYKCNQEQAIANLAEDYFFDRNIHSQGILAITMENSKKHIIAIIREYLTKRK